MAMYLSVQHPGKIRGLGCIRPRCFMMGGSVPSLPFCFRCFAHPGWSALTDSSRIFHTAVKNERLREFIHANMISGKSAEAGNLG